MLDGVSFLLSQGHTEAGDYVLWYLGQEVSVARRRVNDQTRTNAVIMNSAFSASQSKKAFGPFKRLLEMFK